MDSITQLHGGSKFFAILLYAGKGKIRALFAQTGLAFQQVFKIVLVLLGNKINDGHAVEIIGVAIAKLLTEHFVATDDHAVGDVGNCIRGFCHQHVSTLFCFSQFGFGDCQLTAGIQVVDFPERGAGQSVFFLIANNILGA